MANYNKNEIISKYTKRYGDPVRFNDDIYYLTESPQLQFKSISTDKVQLYYSACVLSRREVDESIPDTKGIVNLVEYEMIWKIHDCYINQRGWFYDSEIDGNLVGKKQLISVEDACDWENPLIVRGRCMNVFKIGMESIRQDLLPLIAIRRDRSIHIIRGGERK